MNRRILLLATGPAVLLGLVLVSACVVSAWHINRLQTNMATILSENVASLQAAQQMEIHLRQLRFRCFLYLLNPDDRVLKDIALIEGEFEGWLDRARQVVNIAEEVEHIEAIEKAYARYQAEFATACADVGGGVRLEPMVLYDANPVHQVVEPCQDLFEINQRMILETRAESERISRLLQWFLLLLGVGGPFSGLLVGYGMARGLSRSIYQLSVRVHDVAQRLDQDVASVSVAPNGDIGALDERLRQVVQGVEEVTQRMQRQQREILRAQQLSALGQLAASIAHEVRNPLTSIKMLVEAALRPANPRPFTADNLRVVHGEVVRLEQTVRGFLDFARPQPPQRQSCDLGELFGQSIELIRGRARQQGVELEYQPPAQPLQAAVDGGQLQTVLINLLINALDAMPSGGSLTVKLQADGRDIRLTVADSGPGVAESMVDRMFTPFASTKATGTGLGLSISRRIVEEHGGRLTWVNRPEGGACFTVTLPIAV